MADAQTHLNLGLAYYHQGKLDDAIKEYQEAIRIKPDDACAHCRLGTAYRSKRELDSAIAAYKKAIEMKPDCAEAHDNLGHAYRDKGMLDDAIAAYKEAIRLDPYDVNAHHFLGHAYFDKNMFDEAIREWQRTIELTPNNARLYKDLRDAYFKAGKLDELIDETRQRVEEDTNDARGYYLLALAFAEKGEFERAIESFRKAIELDSSYKPAHEDYIDLIKKRGIFLLALTLFLEACFKFSQKLVDTLSVLKHALLDLRGYGGTFTCHSIQSEAIAKNTMGIPSTRHVWAYLPDGYEEGSQRYPTIYWLCTLMVKEFDSVPLFKIYNRALGEAIRSKKIPPVIVVYIDPRTGKGGSIYFNSPVFGYWEDFLTDEVVPFIDKTYRTIPEMRYRALMGLSIGGYAALMLPLLHPGIWGAVGMNDASVRIGLPEAAVDILKNMPESLADYDKNPPLFRIFFQLGTAISPNPASPIHFDPPIDREGKPVPAVMEKWRDYTPTHPEMIKKNLATLKSLHTIAAIIADLDEVEFAAQNTNALSNLIMIEEMKKQGVSVTQLHWHGGHENFKVERFVALAEQVLKGMEKTRVISV